MACARLNVSVYACVRVCVSVFAADRYKSAAPAAVAVESVRLVLLAVIDT